MAARRSSVFPSDGDGPTAAASSFSVIRPPSSTCQGSTTCRDPAALNPHLPGHNLIHYPFALPANKARSMELLAPVCSDHAPPPLPSLQLQRLPPVLQSSAVHAHTHMELFRRKREVLGVGESRILRRKAWDHGFSRGKKVKERLVGIMRMDYRSPPGDSTPKLKQPSGPRQIVRGSRVVNLGRAADQVFVKARRSRCGNFPRYVACNPRHIIWWCLLETTTIRIYTRPARRTSLIARLASSIS